MGGQCPPPFLWELQWDGVTRQGPPSSVHAECGHMALVGAPPTPTVICNCMAASTYMAHLHQNIPTVLVSK